ncbi:unnamed protein product [Lupinus luteus]|uniref:Reverse transcriptase zinc-binding domain-containing protein n=1 Tax=Lupinus luteus TaxID=3873 RepID=A0AAV1WU89_LUPLU
MLWHLLNKRLPTNEHRLIRFMTDSASCPRCTILESFLHALRDCTWVKEVWMGLFGISSHHSFFSEDLLGRISSNMLNSVTIEDVEWSFVFGMALESIWRSRNLFIFKISRITLSVVALKLVLLAVFARPGVDEA